MRKTRLAPGLALLSVAALPFPRTEAAPDPARLSSEARSVLKRLPGEALTVDVVLGVAALASDSFKSVIASAPLVEVARLQTAAAYDPQLKASTVFQWDRLESSNPTSYESLDLWTSSLEVSKYFASGTYLSGKLGVGKTDVTFSPTFGFPAISSYETKFEFNVVQNLWKDAFGSAVRAASEAGELTSKATELQIREGVEDWTLALLRQYYGAWQLQDRVFSTEASWARQRRLFEASRLKARRGTAEEQDLLRVESSLLNAETAKLQSEDQLRDAWTNLVLALKFPETFLAVEPRNIPIRLDDPVPAAKKLCGQDFTVIQSKNTTHERSRLVSEASKMREAAASGQARPQLQLIAGVSANGQDPSFGATPGEAASFEHPSYTLGLQFSMPLGFRADEAQYRSAHAERLRSEALAGQAASQLRADWLNACRELERLERARGQAREISDKQARRERIEERLFGIGRTSTLNVIQAGEEAGGARSGLAQAEVELRLAAWRVRRLSGEIVPWLQALESESERVRKSL